MYIYIQILNKQNTKEVNIKKNELTFKHIQTTHNLIKYIYYLLQYEMIQYIAIIKWHNIEKNVRNHTDTNWYHQISHSMI